MKYYENFSDDALDKYYSANSPYPNPYDDYDNLMYEDYDDYDNLMYEDYDEYDYFQESFDDDLRKGMWHGNKVW